MMAATSPRTSSTEQGFVVNMVVLNVHTAENPYGLLGEKGERGYGGGGRGRLYTYRYTVTTRMIAALRWAAMRAIFMFQ